MTLSLLLANTATTSSTLPVWAVIAVAAMPVLGGISVAIIAKDNARTRAENVQQHTQGRATLEELVGKVDVVHGDVIAIRDDFVEFKGDHEVTKHRVGQLEADKRRRRT